MYYIFFINNVLMGKSIYSAEEIMNYLFGQNQWAFSIYAQNLKLIDEGDRAVVYLAGKGNRCFAADFTISSKPYRAEKNTNEPDWMSMFPVRIKIQNVNRWVKPLPIYDVKDKIDFIQNKKNYGLYFRQSTKKIGEKDFYTVLTNNFSI